MNTFDFNSKITSSKLNENMFKKFGVKVNLEKYTREELENYRNLVRTEVNQQESTAGFNDLLSNENYQKDKHVLELLNTKIKEMLGEAKVAERKLSAAEKKKKEEIVKAIKRDNPEKRKGKGKSSAYAIATAQAKKTAESKDTTMKTTTEKKKCPPMSHIKKMCQDGKSVAEICKMHPDCDHKELKQMVADCKGKMDETSMPMKKVNGKSVPAFAADGKGKNDLTKDKKVKEALKGGQKKLDVAEPRGKLDAADFKALRSKKSKVKEGVRRAHQYIIIESLKKFIAEDEEGKAKDITAGTDMTNDFTSWMQRVGQYQTKSMIELADSIRSNFGQAEADQFKASIQPALEQALDALTQARETITRAVAVLAGEESAQDQMGMDSMGDMPGGNMGGDIDSMNLPPEDEFGASDAAAGGMETSGRGMRESKFARKLAESHSIMSKLAK